MRAQRIGFVFWLMLLGAAPAVAAPDPLAPIATYAGAWQTHIEHVKTPFSRASTEACS